LLITVRDRAYEHEYAYRPTIGMLAPGTSKIAYLLNEEQNFILYENYFMHRLIIPYRITEATKYRNSLRN